MKKYILQAETPSGVTFTLVGQYPFKWVARYKAWSVNRRHRPSSVLSGYKVVRIK